MTTSTTEERAGPESALGCAAGHGSVDGWSELHAAAWLGFLQTHRQLTRDLEGELEARHGLTLSGLELLSRLAAREERRAHLSTIADEIGLSVSGASRLVDTLEHSGLAERQTCPADGRAVNVWLTDGGLAAVRAAQATHFAGVRERFFDRIEAHELATLANVFERFAPCVPPACDP